jgi:UDPglucose--hexose-1-phosphate uridylyltransferase
MVSMLLTERIVRPKVRVHASRRFNPLLQEWVLVSPQRTERPWQGHLDPPERRTAGAYDPTCYLCPGNARTNGIRNPDYGSTFAFDNDFPALVPHVDSLGDHGNGPDDPSRPDDPVGRHSDEPRRSPRDLLATNAERGMCRVICFSPRHDLTLARMDVPAIRAVIDTWIDECATVTAPPWVKYALVFENRGEMMGASNPHPHCQLWATEHVPNQAAREREGFDAYAARHRGACLLCHYLSREIEVRERLVCETDGFVAVVPFWAVWPFETLVISHRHRASLAELEPGERNALAGILQRVTALYDALFDAPFPYSMGFHQAPVNDGAAPLWHLHAHFFPPLLRSATIRKFMVGFELLGEPQRDLTPEDAAARLREVAR